MTHPNERQSLWSHSIRGFFVENRKRCQIFHRVILSSCNMLISSHCLFSQMFFFHFILAYFPFILRMLQNAFTVILHWKLGAVNGFSLYWLWTWCGIFSCIHFGSIFQYPNQIWYKQMKCTILMRWMDCSIHFVLASELTNGRAIQLLRWSKIQFYW